MAGYLTLPQTNGEYAKTVDAAPLDITTDIDVRVRVAADDYTPAAASVLVSKMGAAGKRSWRLYILAGASGKPVFQWSENGSALIGVVSTVGAGITDGTVKWIRATLDVDDGAGGYEVKFYLSDNGTDWTQLGATVVGGSTTSIFSGIAPVEVGSYAVGLDPFGGKVFNAEIRDGIGGTVEFDADFTDLSAGEVAAKAFTEDSTNAATVTLEGTSWTYDNITAAVAGTVSDGALESEIISGGETAILTLTNDTWAATVGDDNAITDALVAGLDSDGSEAAGWDAVVKANMVFGDVARTSDTVVTVTLGAEPTYAITASETITATLPATALAFGLAVVAAPTFAISNDIPGEGAYAGLGPVRALRDRITLGGGTPSGNEPSILVAQIVGSTIESEVLGHLRDSAGATKVETLAALHEVIAADGGTISDVGEVDSALVRFAEVYRV